MANSIVKTNIDKYARAIVDSNFTLHDWEDIVNSAGASVDEFPVIIPKGDWGTDSSNAKVYIIYSSFFEAEGYNYFLYPEGASAPAYGNAGITALEVGAGYVKLTCTNKLEEAVKISFFRLEQEESEQPSNIATIYPGIYDSSYGNLTITIDDTYEDINSALDNKGLTYINTKMYLGGNDLGYNAYLFNRANLVKDDEIDFTFLNLDTNGTVEKMGTAQTYFNFFHALTGYEPQE